MRATTALVFLVFALGSARAAGDHDHMNMAGSPLPHEGGQSAFAAIQEIVGMLEADPSTDWSKVNIEALRQHLVDMDNVALRVRIDREATATGERFHVVAEGPVRTSVQRMIKMHVAMAGDTGDWHMEAVDTPDGAIVTVSAKSPPALQKMRALGLIGMMAQGMHHAPHHLMLATGKM